MELRKGRKDVIINGILISSFHPYGLTGSQRVVAGIALLYSLLDERRRIRIDDDCGPCLEVVYSFPDLHGVVIEMCRIHGDETQMTRGLSGRNHFFSGLGYQGTY